MPLRYLLLLLTPTLETNFPGMVVVVCVTNLIAPRSWNGACGACVRLSRLSSCVSPLQVEKTNSVVRW